MMDRKKMIRGFSRLSKMQKLQAIAGQYFEDPEAAVEEISSFWLQDEQQQQILDGFSENTISNYILPFGVAPNFLIDGRTFCIPMVIEESSVVAAVSNAAKFWHDKGGFNTSILGTVKVGQVHFMWSGSYELMNRCMPELKQKLLSDATSITSNMQQRGGGVLDIELLDFTDQEADYFQLRVKFETCDSMGANFINSVLESFADSLASFVLENDEIPVLHKDLKIIMAILSNYTPECIVEARVSCPVSQLNCSTDTDPEQFAWKFEKAVRIAQIDPYRATTHNKGIFNGVDAVILATANDFRAIESCGHTYACRDGQYRSLSYCKVENDIFHFWIQLPLAIGTIGGLTSLHPLARRSMQLLGNPTARQLMGIIASVGLAQNFAAVRSLITAGIQKGHMKMHLTNILNQLNVPVNMQSAALEHFKDKTISYSAVRSFLESAGPATTI
ncbi:MAG: hydroxymethylglutaryl-CoA reductase, degradative [Saprospiraceae bacterium]|nr:hydroxymethylglutaryl-CoA reductase, degradative [Saprospiraceae bacterium]